MGIELHVRSAVLERVVYQSTQQQLRLLQIEPVLGIYVDHIDVVQDGVALARTDAGVELRLHLDVYLETELGVRLAVDRTPPGATTPAGRFTIAFVFACAGGRLTITCSDVALENVGEDFREAIAPIMAAVRDGIGQIAGVDLAPTARALGAEPTSTALDLVDGVLIARFNAAGPAVPHLFAGQDWGLFVDGPAIERWVDSTLPNHPSEWVTTLNTHTHWRPDGMTPHLDVDFDGKAQVPDPFSGDFTGTFSIAVAVVAGSVLQTTADWNVDLDYGALVPDVLEQMIENDIPRHMDPARFGGVALGERRFAVDTPLAPVALGDVDLRCTGILAGPQGMTVGGTARFPPDPSRAVLALTVQPFTPPARVDFCSILAAAGSDVPDPITELGDLRASAWVTIADQGRFAAADVVGANERLQPFVHAPDPGAIGESDEVDVRVPADLTPPVADAVEVRIRTARGVRVVSVGVPPRARPDGHGGYTGVIHSYIDDCLYREYGPYDEDGVNWGAGIVDGIDWDGFLHRSGGLKVHLLDVHGLEAGELLEVRTRDHAADIVADADGSALLPVMVAPLASARGAVRRAGGGVAARPRGGADGRLRARRGDRW